jgi:predicted permease
MKRWSRLLRRDSIDEELSEEIRFHLDARTRMNRNAGMNESDAANAARRQFGNVTHVQEESRRMHISAFFDTTMQDLRYAARGFLRTPGFTFTALFAIAIGIGASTAVFSVVDRILFRSLPYRDSDRLVSFGFTAPIEPGEFMLGTDYYEWRQRQTAFESMTAWSDTVECSITDQNPAQLACARVEWTFLPTFGVQPLTGRNFTRDEDLPSGPGAALISYGLWQSRFGRNPGVIGSAISLDGVPITLIGVLPRDFELPSLARADILLPRKLDPANQRRPNTGAVLRSFARLKPGVTIAQAHAALEPLFQESLKWIPAQFRKEVGLRVRSLRDRQIADARLASWMLLGSVACVLLIACANVANLLLARGASRRREGAVRSALGAGRARLARQGITESLLLAIAGGALGCGVAYVLLRLFVSIGPGSIPRLEQASLDLRVLLFTIIASIVSGLLFGVVPALEKPKAEDLTGARQTGSRHAFFKQALIAGEMAMALMLLTAAALLLRTLWHVQNESLGMRTEHVITATIPLPATLYQKPEQQIAYFEEVESRLSRIPGIKAAAVSDSVPPGGMTRARPFATLEVEGIPRLANGIGGMVDWRAVTPGYFNALGIPILRGRGFTEADRHANGRFVIFSEMLARKFFQDPGQAVGRSLKFTFDKEKYTIVGIAENVKNSNAPGARDPEYYVLRRHERDGPYNRSSAIVRADMDPRAAAEWLRAEISGIDPRLPIEIETMQQRAGRVALRPKFNATLLAIFAAMGLLLAAVGLYGVVSFLVVQRTQEIGVRVALGATRQDIARLMLSHAARWTVSGAVIGGAASLIVTRWLKSLLFNVPARDPWSLLAACALLVAAALAAGWIPSRRAAMLDPTTALRRE